MKEEQKSDFEKEFGTQSDYFNHRLGLFMDMDKWIADRESKLLQQIADLTERVSSLTKENEWLKEQLELSVDQRRVLSILNVNQSKQINEMVEALMEAEGHLPDDTAGRHISKKIQAILSKP